jgi:GH25 family lysozyme M1 (1,4-beta-N-acetylmuramidase)
MFSYVLRKEDKGQEVKRLQSALKITSDGDFGPLTEKAVKRYQAANKLAVDGVAGPQTLGHLDIKVLPGIDVSSHNGTVDWGKVASAGIKFAWVKTTEGQTHVNRNWVKRYNGALDNNIVAGVYHFARPDFNNYDSPEADAVAEFNHFRKTLNQVGGLKSGNLVPAIDLEAGMKTDDQYNADWYLEWLRLTEEEWGVKGIVYTAKWAWNLYLRKANKKDLQKFTEYPVWWANYIRKDRLVGPEEQLRGWSEWNVWQYTGHGTCPGIKGSVDLNWMPSQQLLELKMP